MRVAMGAALLFLGLGPSRAVAAGVVARGFAAAPPAASAGTLAVAFDGLHAMILCAGAVLQSPRSQKSRACRQKYTSSKVGVSSTRIAIF